MTISHSRNAHAPSTDFLVEAVNLEIPGIPAGRTAITVVTHDGRQDHRCRNRDFACFVGAAGQY
jgi:hypothetical protein